MQAFIKNSDLPDPRSGSVSGRIWPDINLKKKSGSGSGRILIKKKRLGPDSGWILNSGSVRSLIFE